MYKIAALLFWMILLAPGLQAQEQKNVTIRLQTAEAERTVISKYKLKTTQPDSLSALNAVKELVLHLQSEAYLTASADSFYFRNDTLLVQLYVGQQYAWARLRNGNLAEGLVEKSGFRERFFKGKPFRPQDFVKLQERILEYAENNGYPFASLKLDSVVFRGSEIEAAINLDRGPLITFDTIMIEGKSKTQTKFLGRYLQIFRDQPYDHQRVKSSQRLLKQLPYITVVRPPQVRFAGNKARVYLFLEDKRNSQIDGIVGVLPDPDALPSERKLLITGEANLNIRNIQGTGKQLGLQWRRVDRGSVLLDGSYLHPNLLGSPFELGAKFNLLKQDSSFVTIRPRLQFSYNTLRFGKVTFFADFLDSRLGYSGSYLQTLETLPPQVDVKYTSYGIAYLWNNLDDFYFPRKGFLGSFQGAAGNKIIQRNPAINQELYDTIPLRSTQFSFSLLLDNYVKVGRNSVILTRLRSESLLNNQLFLNDLYRIGGLASIRGFNEFAFYASTYAVGTLEYRIFTAADSYLLLFYDQGYYRRNLTDDFVEEFPFGFGAGVSFNTGAGIFQFVYSLGQSKALNQRLAVNNSKIHFGITTRF